MGGSRAEACFLVKIQCVTAETAWPLAFIKEKWRGGNMGLSCSVNRPEPLELLLNYVLPFEIHRVTLGTEQKWRLFFFNLLTRRLLISCAGHVTGESKKTQCASVVAGHGQWGLKRVASRGRFVVFVALQRERGNAHIKVGAICPLNTKRPPHVTTGGL